MRPGTHCLASLICMLALAAPAGASTVSVEQAPDVLTFTAAPGEANDLTISAADSGHYTVTDTGSVITAGAGCTSVTEHQATCVAPATPYYGPRLAVALGDLDDSADLSGIDLPGVCTYSGEVTGGEGNDTLTSPGAGGCNGDYSMAGGPGDDTLILAPGSSYVADGDDGNDVLVGNPYANTLNGGAGDDEITGDRGDDVLSGGDGFDVVRYDYPGIYETWQVVADLADPSQQAGTQLDRDWLTGFEGVVGGAGNDILLGTDGPNLLAGGPGDDVLEGRGGPDDLVGGDGYDVADYSERATPVTVTLDGTPNSGNDEDGPAGERDLTDGVEDIWGGSGNDVLTGNDASNLLNGGPGADVLAGLGGPDIADYSERTTPVTVALDGTPNSGNDEDGPSGARDQVSTDIEEIFGGSGNDTLSGNAYPNLLDSGEGDDQVNSRDESADLVFCGPGTDTAKIDALDAVDSCETATTTDTTTAPPPPPPPPAPVAPTVTLKLPAHQSLRTLRSSGLLVQVTCSAACTLDARLTAGTSVRKRLRLPATLGRVTRTVGKPVAVKLRIKLTKRARARLVRVRQLRLTLAIAARGNGLTRTARRTLTLTRTRAKLSAATTRPRFRLRSAHSARRSPS